MPGGLKVICTVGKQQWRSSPRAAVAVGEHSTDQAGGARTCGKGHSLAPSALPRAGWPQALLRHHSEQRFLLSVSTGHASATTRPPDPASLHLPQQSTAIPTSECHSVSGAWGTLVLDKAIP